MLFILKSLSPIIVWSVCEALVSMGFKLFSTDGTADKTNYMFTFFHSSSRVYKPSVLFIPHDKVWPFGTANGQLSSKDIPRKGSSGTT
jgi:hypothetical protein